MAHHTLTLNYGADGSFRPDKDDLPVMTGDTISFQLGTAPPSSRFKITMSDPTLFSPAEVTDSKTQVKVVKAAKATYACQLFDHAGDLLNWEGHAGGSTRPGGPKGT